MPEIKCGLISQTDAVCLMRTIDLIAEDNTNGFINVTEVGVYAGETGNFIRECIKSKGLECCLTGIDNEKDGEPMRFEYDKFIKGNSNEVYNQIPDGSQDLIFIDGLHTFAAVVADFFCYAGKVKKGGFICFHDTASHIDPLSGWQGIGDKNDPDFCLGGVKKALGKIGLIEEDEYEFMDRFSDQWDLVFDEADPNDAGGGICVFKKLY